jgi:Ca2+-binding RTX toxin-like protein
MTSKLAIGKSTTTQEIINYSNGNTKANISVTGAYPFELIKGITNLNTPNLPLITLSKTYGTGAVGFNVEIAYDATNKTNTLSLSGSIDGFGLSGSFTVDKNYNVSSVSGFAGIQIIGGDKTVIAGIPYGADAILRLGFQLDQNGIKFTSNNQASIGFIVGDFDVSASAGVDVVDFNKILSDSNNSNISNQTFINNANVVKTVPMVQNSTSGNLFLGILESAYKTATPFNQTLINKVNYASSSFGFLSNFESTSKIGSFSLSSSNTIKTFPTTNSSVNNLGFIIGKSSNYVSPLTFDLDGDGIETNHIYSQNVYFDIDADGFAEKVGWIHPDDGQLAFDANKNGKIDDITELFGDDKQPAFDKLKMFDSNKNGKIDAGDAKFNELLVWRDLSQDGKTNAGELKTLTETGIKEISLNEVKETTYQNENYISGRAKYTLTNGVQRDIADVHFLNDNINTWFNGAQSQEFGNNFTIDPTTLLMPLSRGYGSLPSLHIAITQNSVLKTMMLDIMNLKPQGFGQLAGKMQDFLLEWAGVRGNDPHALDPAGGSHIDARQVDFIEKFTGITWAQRGTADFTGPDASVGLKKTWSHIMDMMTTRILVQGPLKAVFADATYDFVTDKMTLGDNFNNLITKAKNFAGVDASTAHDYWLALGNILTAHREDLGVSMNNIVVAVDNAYGKLTYIGSLFPAGILQSYAGEVLFTSSYHDQIGADNMTGSNFNDVMFGDWGNDIIRGRDGDDNLNGGEGHNTIYGDAGRDTLFGNGGNDTLYGGDDTDYIEAGNGNDVIYGGNGDDTIKGGAGADYVDGGDGKDTAYFTDGTGVYANLATNIFQYGNAQGDTYINIENLGGSHYNDTLIGNALNNYINGEQGDDFIDGGDGNDDLFGSLGNNKIYGGNGDDYITAYNGIELFDGGNGNDTVNYSHPYLTGAVNIDLSTGIYGGLAINDTLISIENVTGTFQGNDRLVGNAQNNILSGNGGNDTIAGRAGDDKLYGNDGDDRIWGDDGNDTLFGGTGNDMLYGLNGNDIFVDGIGRDYMSGGDGIDEVQYHYSTAGVNVNITTNIGFGGSAEGDTYAGIENIWGSYYNDTLTGDALDNYLYGDNGDDALDGGVGNDVINGGVGNDTLYGSDGTDKLYGGDGIDTLSYAKKIGWVEVRLDAGTVMGFNIANSTVANIENLTGSDTDADTLVGNSGNNRIIGMGGNDTIAGRAGDDTLSGVNGNDRIWGEQGNDVILGGNGDDTIWGQDGNDYIIGGLGSDTLSGGLGNDRFVYDTVADSFSTAKDIITDFQTGIDKISFGFTENISNVLIQAGAGFNTVSIANTNFSIQVNNNITLADIAIAA